MKLKNRYNTTLACVLGTTALLLSSVAHAATDLTEVTTGITDAETAAKSIMGSMVAIWVVFMIFKVIRRGTGKA